MSPETTIFDVLKVIDAAALEVALVSDNDGKLTGTVTDGDIRRGILRGLPLDAPVSLVMNSNPITADHLKSDDELLFIMSKHSIKHLPIVDNQGRIVNLRLLKELVSRQRRPNCAVIMAGGLGTRLGQLTRTTPKPLLPIGEQPILSIIVDQLRRNGIWKIFISINYKAEMIREFFERNPREGSEIRFLEEKTFLGTAGALSLLPREQTEPVLVMNGDILTTVNFSNLLDYHSSHSAAMTVCTREYSFEIPYGVVIRDGAVLQGIEEKPLQQLLINTGIYVVSPETIDRVQPETSLDMPTLINNVAREGLRIVCYPLSEFWIDIGNPADYSRARDARIEEA